MFGLESGQYFWIDITISLIIFGIGYFVRSRKRVVKEVEEKVL